MHEAFHANLTSVVSFDAVQRAAHILAGVANRTPVMTSRTINSKTGATVFFKCENYQRIGAFKFRGAYYALSQLSPDTKGVIAYSSGNHAQAVALAGKLLDISTTIVMPEDAPTVKINATRGYGANIVLYNKAEITREKLATDIAQREDLTIIPPYDHPHVIAGQGTTALELIEEAGPLDALLVCCGGGGLLSGCAITSKSLTPQCEVIGVEPAVGNDAARTFHSGVLQQVHNPDTIADGARTPYLGTYTHPIISNYVDDILTATDEQLRQTMFLLWERMKIVVEPTGVLAASALLHHTERFTGKRVGVVLTGGNVDLKEVARFF